MVDYADLREVGWMQEAGPRLYRLDDYEIPLIVRVTVEGRSHIEEEAVNVNSVQGFIAMWFDDSMEEASRDGIEPAIKEAGFSPLLINQKAGCQQD